MGFKVGDVVLLSDGKNTVLSRINGIRKGYLRVGYILFDWCGKEVDVPNPHHRIYPLSEKFKI